MTVLAPPALNELLSQLNAQSRRVRWDSGSVCTKYCQRSLTVLEASGDIGFTSPCADLSLMFAALAWRQQRQPVLVLCSVERPMQMPKFQSCVELEFDGQWHTVGFSETAFRTYQGLVTPSRYRKRILRQPYTGETQASFLGHFHEHGLDGVKDIFAGYDKERDFAWHIQRNSRWRYAFTKMRARFKSGPTVFPEALSWA